ncbi:MAG: DEAD/DEAH box helicase [Candidatus Woesearchaeota archaeon]|nr:DEAD/DEAH box helicase [Candidatus Woesearchaeota archaeon]
MQYKGLTLDKFQEDAIEAIESNNSVVVSAPTGSGKTLIADYIINRDIKKGIKVIYTAPIKALSNQKYREFSADYGEDAVGLLTGDIVINPKGQILIMTTEIYRNMVLSGDDLIKDVSYVIFDEIHYINDVERGYVWEESIIFSASHVRFLCLSATIPNAEEFAAWIQAISNHKVVVIKHTVRPVPLKRYFYDAQLGICSLDEINDIADIPEYHHAMRHKGQREKVKKPNHIALIREIKDKLPCLFFTFSRNLCQQNALALSKEHLFPPNAEITSIIRQKLASAPPEISQLESTKILRETLPYGIGFHHAGELPVIKEMIEELFGKGMIKVLYVTETFAVGINMPAKSVCFDSMRKFDGINFRFLYSKEYFQISGRAGRRGIDKEGFAFAMIDRRDFDYGKLRQITDEDKEPIVSQFRLSVNTVLNLIKNHPPDEIQEILCKSFNSFQKYGMDYAEIKNKRSHRAFENIKSKLERLGYIDGNELTEKGEFSSRIYADEILFGEIFATDFYKSLNEYQILIVLACICNEASEKTEFENEVKSKDVAALRRILIDKGFMKKDRRFNYFNEMTSLIYPAYKGESIFEVIKNTTMLEGDVMRFFRQILDRIGQIRNAANDRNLITVMDDCQNIIQNCIKDVDIV